MEILYFILLSFIWWSFIAAFAISGGYHRYFTHRSFIPRNKSVYEFFVLLLGSLAGGAPLLGWVGAHRMHHFYSDTPKDPHSPVYVGFLRVLTSTWRIKHIPRKFIKDLFKNKLVVFFYKYFTVIRISTFIIGFLLLPLGYFLSLIVAPVFYAYLGYGLVNSLGHWHGKPRNSIIANVFSAGEGYHLNHHDEPWNWKLGKKWYHFDTGAIIISIIKADK